MAKKKKNNIVLNIILIVVLIAIGVTLGKTFLSGNETKKQKRLEEQQAKKRDTQKEEQQTKQEQGQEEKEIFKKKPGDGFKFVYKTKEEREKDLKKRQNKKPKTGEPKEIVEDENKKIERAKQAARKMWNQGAQEEDKTVYFQYNSKKAEDVYVIDIFDKNTTRLKNRYEVYLDTGEIDVIF